ncbi:diguanylate cyclase [Methylobacterium oryzae]|uniref:diguanylate cyclase n=1 Tax=Methylobacterium oryzae TaxID=334852 RepID=UPI002F350094
MLDLDRFKLINDRYGHSAGDTVLKAFVETCRDSLRAVDVIGRMGGIDTAATTARIAAQSALPL